MPGALAYSLNDAAQLSGLSRATLRRRAAEGALRLVRVGGRTLVPADSLKRLLDIAE
jgi:excisionase family DNA binding protein